MHINFLSLYIIFIAVLTTIACLLPGTFLMLRGIALLSDAISHAILPGIVIMALMIKNLDSPLLIIGASLSGVLTVVATEIIIQSKRLKKDAAIGLVFPVFFSSGIVLISLYARTIHLDLDMVLLGELAFTPFNRLIFYGIDIGPHALWIMGVTALINTLFVICFYKELIITTFDPLLAHTLGFSLQTMYYSLMIITSFTAVNALSVVGSTIIVALMLTAPATAFLLTHRLNHLIIVSIFYGTAFAVSGYTLAAVGNLSIAGSIACMGGIIFGIAFLCAPQKGLCAQLFLQRRQRRLLACSIVCSYLSEHTSATAESMAQHLQWHMRYTQKILDFTVTQGFVTHSSTLYSLTPQGHACLFDQNL